MASSVFHPKLSQEFGEGLWDVYSDVTPDGRLVGYAVKLNDSPSVDTASVTAPPNDLLPPKLRKTLREDAESRRLPEELMRTAQDYLDQAEESFSTKSQRRVAPDARASLDFADGTKVPGSARALFFEHMADVLEHCDVTQLDPVEVLTETYSINKTSASTWIRAARDQRLYGRSKPEVAALSALKRR
jgi:hypothetical protein